MNTNNFVKWVILQNNADWDCFKTPILQDILRIKNPLLEEHYAFLEVIHFVPISWMCKKQTSVSHSSTESGIISLDAGLRLDWIPALDLWDLIVLVLGITTQNHDGTGQPGVGRDTSHEPSQQSRGMFNVLNNVDRVPQTSKFRIKKLCCMYEDNDAVLKMIFKGRRPTMRHISRTHRVALDWLFDRIKVDPKIQIKYIDTKNQLDDILTKGNFTRDEWIHLLCLFKC